MKASSVRLFENIVINAVLAMPAGGRITIKAGQMRDRRVRHSLRTACLSVSGDFCFRRGDKVFPKDY